MAGDADAGAATFGLGQACVPHPVLHLLHYYGGWPDQSCLAPGRGRLSVEVRLEEMWAVVGWELGKILCEVDEHKVSQCSPHHQLVEIRGDGQA